MGRTATERIGYSSQVAMTRIKRKKEVSKKGGGGRTGRGIMNRVTTSKKQLGSERSKSQKIDQRGGGKAQKEGKGRESAKGSGKRSIP